MARTYLGDRRGGLRFQVNGQLWASVGVLHDAVLHNISAGGALLEATLSQELRSTRAATLRLPGNGPELTVRICRVTEIDSAPNRYLLGVEFISLTNAQRQAVASLTATRNPRSSDAG